MVTELKDFLFAMTQRFLSEEQNDGSMFFTLYDQPFDLVVTADETIEIEGESYDSVEAAINGHF